jgi:GT2 family glycosyltransferase
MFSISEGNWGFAHGFYFLSKKIFIYLKIEFKKMGFTLLFHPHFSIIHKVPKSEDHFSKLKMNSLKWQPWFFYLYVVLDY